VPDSLPTIGLIVTVALAFLGYAFKYWNEIQLEKRKAEIKYVSDQIQYLYGPLYGLCAANQTAWETFMDEFRPEGAPFFPEEGSPTEEELLAWRRWTKEVFMPLNRAILEVILTNTHLIEDKEFPEPFSEFISHVKPYEVVLAKWQDNDFSEHTAYSNYPEEINDYVQEKFSFLKKRQVKLLASYRVST
jgi:hypothetical protein